MAEQEAKQRRPFHETIVDAIRDVTNGPSDIMGRDFLATLLEKQIEVLAKLIKATKIPAGHLKIIAAWNCAIETAELNEESFGVMADLLEQWQEAVEKEKTQASKEQAGAVSP